LRIVRLRMLTLKKWKLTTMKTSKSQRMINPPHSNF
jgi:hypothetical protein